MRKRSYHVIIFIMIFAYFLINALFVLANMSDFDIFRSLIVISLVFVRALIIYLVLYFIIQITGIKNHFF
jgi:uncharacterized membrane protein (GlpM family)